MPKWTLALLRSRKFWLALLAEIGGVVLYAQGAIDANTLVNLTLALVGAVIAAITAEDVALKLHSGQVHF